MFMPSLRELQMSVMDAVLGGSPAVDHSVMAAVPRNSPAADHSATDEAPSSRPAADYGTMDEVPGSPSATDYVCAHGISPAQRLGIYANTAQSNFISSLVSNYPAIQRLVGEDYFRQCARDFHRRHPSRSGDLQPAGAQFPSYLSALHGGDEYRYLGEIARLEWLIQEALLAADQGPLDLAALGTVAPSAYDELRFELHPSARLFLSPYPCLRIWEANVGSEAEPDLIDLSAGSDRLLLLRSLGQLRFHPLSEGEENFLRALQAHESFAAAIERGAPDPDFDAAAALQRFVVAGAIVDFE